MVTVIKNKIGAILVIAVLAVFSNNAYSQCPSVCPAGSIVKTTTYVLLPSNFTYTITYKECGGYIEIISMSMSGAINGFNGLEIQNVVPLIFQNNPAISQIAFPASCYSGILLSGNEGGPGSSTSANWGLTWCSPGCCIFDKADLDPDGNVPYTDLSGNSSCRNAGCWPICGS